MKVRTIKSIVYAAPFDMGGLPVRQAFPSTKTEHVDPFLLLHHAEFKVPAHIGTTSPLKTLSSVNTYTMRMKKGGKYNVPVNPEYNAFIYLLDGKVVLNQKADIDGKYVVIFNKDGDGIEIEAIEDTRIMMGTAKPLHEPVASHGPFVMNNQTQLLEAFKDYQLGKMGVLIED